MKIISDTTTFHTDTPSAVAIGKFDGMHLGHRKLIGTLLSQAKEKGLQSVVFTFDPSPTAFFSGEVLPELFTREEKRRAFEKMGVDLLIEFPLNEESAAITARDFVTGILCGSLSARLIVAGSDLSFGFRGEGDFDLLNGMQDELGYETLLVDKLMYGSREISSSYAREAVESSDIDTACALLGEPYAITGSVTHGKRLGRTIGFPTVNLTPPKEKLLPGNGVYFTRTRIDGRIFDGMTNIGVRPTVSDTGQKSVETHLLDCDEDLYGKEIEVLLYHFHREEKTFADVDALKAQLMQDAEKARIYWQNNALQDTATVV